MANGFSQISSLAGFDIAYDSSKEHNVGVIDVDLLPADNILYRYYFAINPRPIDTSILMEATFGGIGLGFADLAILSLGSEVRTSRDFVEFMLDFVVSEPRFNTIVTADATDAANGHIELRDYPLTVAYIFEVQLDENNNIEFIIDENGTQHQVVSETPVGSASPPQINMPTIPSSDERGKSWFDFYQSFEDGGEYDSFNLFQGKSKSDDFDFTYNNKDVARSTDTKRVRIKNITAGKTYAVTYDGITNHLYRQVVRLDFVKFNFISAGISLNGYDPPFVEKRRVYHYLFKQWTDSDGNIHKGWRLSESWNGDLFVHRLQDFNQPFDIVDNPIVGKKTDREGNWGVFNMSNDNLNKKDSERVAYNRNYAIFLNDRAKAIGGAIPDVDTNELVIDSTQTLADLDALLHKDIFQIEFVSNNIVNYLGEGDVVVDVGGPIGIIFRANDLTYQGYWESQFYKRFYPRNTRIVNVFNRATNGVVGVIIADKVRKSSASSSCVADGLLAASIGRRLNYHLFDSGTYSADLGRLSHESQFDRFMKFSNTPHPGSSFPDTFPAKNICTGKYRYKTFIDDSDLTSNTSPKSGGNSSTVNLQISETNISTGIENITRPTVSIETVLGNTVYTFGFTTSKDNIVAVKLNVTFDTDASVFKIRGWNSELSNLGVFIDRNDSKPVREITNITVINNKDSIIDLSVWEGISFVECISTQPIASVNSIELLYIEDSSLGNHFENDIFSLSCHTSLKNNLLIFYTNRENRLNALTSSDRGISWTRYENIFIRGDSISDIRGIANVEDAGYFLFYFYKEALLMSYINLDPFNMASLDIEKEARLFDSIRRQDSNLIWGKVIKDPTEIFTEIDSVGNVTFQDITDNIILTETDRNDFYSRTSPADRIISDPIDQTIDSSHNLNQYNKFIFVGQAINISNISDDIHLAKSNPTSKDYSIYINAKGILRLMIRYEGGDNPTYRCLESSDNGVNWRDAWRFQGDLVRINNLSSGVSTEEGSNIHLLYTRTTNQVFIFYFYLDCILCKVISDLSFDLPIDDLTPIVNDAIIYAVCGNLTNLESEKKTSLNPDGKIVFGKFQNDNFNKYYSSAEYSPQTISGYVAKRGHPRIFAIRDDRSIDGYYFDGNEWIPEQVLLEDSLI